MSMRIGCLQLAPKPDMSWAHSSCLQPQRCNKSLQDSQPANTLFHKCATIRSDASFCHSCGQPHHPKCICTCAKATPSLIVKPTRRKNGRLCYWNELWLCRL